MAVNSRKVACRRSLTRPVRNGVADARMLSAVAAAFPGTTMLERTWSSANTPPTVIAVDLDQRKLALARELGATDLVDASQVDPVSAIRELTGGFGADVTVEAVGHPDVMKQAFHARDHAGTMIQSGVPDPTMRVDLRMLDFYGRGGQLRPSWYGDSLPTRDFPILVGLYLRGRYDLDRFVSETIALDQVEEAFARMQRNEVLRSVVVLPDDGPAGKGSSPSPAGGRQ
jgi:Zn-dependent alcohol dehydrogenase